MSTTDTCITIVPYFKIHPGKEAEIRKLCDTLVRKVSTEAGCLYYGFTFKGDEFFCREGYQNADALLAHMGHVGAELAQAFQMSDLTRLEVHGPAGELEKLKAPLKDLNPEYWELEYGFRNS